MTPAEGAIHPNNMDSGYEALRNGCAWIDLSRRGQIRVTGEDAGRLLHAMSTNNVKELAVGHGLYAFFLNDKGRILADANIFRFEDFYLVDTEPATAETLFAHLDRYLIADDAELANETGSRRVFGIEGEASEEAMKKLSLPVPEHALEIIQTGWGAVARVAATGAAGFRIWADGEFSIEFGMPQASADDVKAVRLERGIPVYGEDISERYLVQETQQFRAMNFNKGCYLGQEIVERVRSQGKVHRLLTPIRVGGSAVPPAGAKLMFNQAAAGEITSAAYSPALGEVVGLAYLRSEILENRPMMRVMGSEPAVEARVA